jgi:UDP-N-acetylmuramyl pentapeptide synthase
MRALSKKIVVYILTLEARAVVRKYRPKIIAVTGSVGKTATKDAIYAVVSRGAHVRKSQKSFNSETGIPLTILGCPNGWNNPLRWLQNVFDGLLLIIFPHAYPQWLVLEVGADRPGDIKSLSRWLPVDIAVITRLPEVPVHVEFFDSPEAVAEEKASLIGAVKKDGTLILYGDDAQVRALSTRAQAPTHIVLFGFSQACQVRAEDFTVLYEKGDHIPKGGWPTGMSARLIVDGASEPVEMVGALGTHALLPLLAGASVGRVLGKSIGDIASALRSYDPPPGRMHLIHGLKHTLIIDDTYNSSPAAASAALDALKLLVPNGRTIAVLGDMLELGKHSVDEHRKVGAHAAQCADILMTVGFRARDMAQGALDNGMKDAAILQFERSNLAGEALETMLKEEDCILVKGSQSMRMENIVEEIMAQPEQASQLLVRQDDEWKKR